MKILVLGGTGAMGAPLVSILAKKNLEVYVTTRQSRVSQYPNVHYLKGNAQELNFIKTILADSFDVIVDFMLYDSGTFQKRTDLYLSNTKQYFFFSSSRVYADSKIPITETSPRLLDVIEDTAYLKTDEYALAKAREENVLINSQYRNWVIIRPYITYSTERLQLGIMEKEFWLHRALRGKKIVFSRDVAEKYTTLTHGYDVAIRIAELVGKYSSSGQIYHIATEEYIKWGDVLELYLDVIEEVTEKRPLVHWMEDTTEIGRICHDSYRAKYDRLYNRRLDNSKIEVACGLEGIAPYTEVRKGLRECLIEYLRKNSESYKVPYRSEGNFDRITGERILFKDIHGITSKIKYFLGFYFKV